MKKSRWIFITIALCGIFFESCVSTINYGDLNLAAKNNSQKILNLKYYNYTYKQYFYDSENIARQKERLIKNGLLDTSSEEYGYCYLIYGHSNREDTGLGSAISGVFDYSEHVFKLTLFLFIGTFSPFFPIALPATLISFTWGLVTGASGIALSAAAFPLILVGVPSESAKFRIKAKLYIFDSGGNMVKNFEKRDTFRQTAGLYYGHNPTKKAGRVFSGLFEELFQTANMESDEINQALRAAGPITEENKDQAMKSIQAYLIEDIQDKAYLDTLRH